MKAENEEHHEVYFADRNVIAKCGDNLKTKSRRSSNEKEYGVDGVHIVGGKFLS